MENHPTKPLLFVIFLSSLILQSRACNPTDEEALVHFKKLITQDPFTLLVTWIPGTDCCVSWVGISCDPSSGRVVSISPLQALGDDDAYNGVSMSGTLSPFLGNLSSLQILDLCALLYLTELGKLTSLKQLLLCQNRLTGPIPGTIQGLSQLQRLYLDSNRLTGPIPDLFFNNLTELSLSQNQLSGSIPSSINKMVSLTVVGLYENNFSGSILESIGELKNLVELNLSGNRLTGPIPSSLGNLPSLGRIGLSYNKLEGRIPPSLGNLKDNLQLLFLSGNRLTGPIPTQLANLQKLETLDLSVNKLSGGIPQEVINLKNLLDFNVSWNRLRGEIPRLQRRTFPAEGFLGNPGLCGAPLPPCNN